MVNTLTAEVAFPCAMGRSSFASTAFIPVVALAGRSTAVARRESLVMLKGREERGREKETRPEESLDNTWQDSLKRRKKNKKKATTAATVAPGAAETITAIHS